MDQNQDFSQPVSVPSSGGSAHPAAVPAAGRVNVPKAKKPNYMTWFYGVLFGGLALAAGIAVIIQL